MSEIADFLRARLVERRAIAEAATPGSWFAIDGGVADGDGEQWPVAQAESDRDRADRVHIAANDPATVIVDLDAKLALVDEIEPPAIAEPEPASEEPETGWCCGGYTSECPLCPEYGTSLLTTCPGHPGTGTNKTRIVEARLHARFAHPGYEYRTTEGARKQWDGINCPPVDENGGPDPTWERNIDAGHPGSGWERFDYTEESYWRRPRPGGVRPPYIPRGLRILAQPFAGHPDHKGGEWAP